MIFDPGSRLGPYEIRLLAGRGGMGDVYRARDTRLDRDVAIKVLPPGIATSPVRRARFEREARAISRLNHPHICTVHDVGECEGVAFLVMEYIEGPSLDHRLRAGRLPLAEALQAAIEIASALGAAHEQGIVHRDLKPGNVMLSDSGVKLVDFGIAKLLDEDSLQQGGASAATLTAEHRIPGTINYMAPEQLEGRDVDQRADLFAFGALLYEMLTGQKAFPGSSAASVTAAVLTAEPPPFSAVLPDHATVPREVDHIIRRALAKQPEDRWQTARDLMLELRSVADDPSRQIVDTLAPHRVPARRWLLVATVAVAIAGAVLAWNLWSPTPRDDRRPPTVLTVAAPEGTTLDPGYGALAVSPDGLKIAFVAATTESRSIWIRYLNSTLPQRLVGSEGARSPFWSPDSRVVAFYDATRRISQIGINGGKPEVITPAAGSMPAACWLPDNSIVFNRDRELMRVPGIAGAVVNPFTAPDESRNEHAFWFPSSLPDGSVLFIVRGPHLNSGSRIRHLSGDDVIDLPTVSSNAAFAAGHLVFRQGPALVAQRFDPRTGRFSGQPVVLAYDVLFNPASGRTVFSASDDVIAYRSSAPRRLTWADRTGRRIGSIGDEGRDWNPVLAPDGSNRVVFDRFDAATGGFQVWTMDDQGHPAALTHGVKERVGVWSPDGEWIVYAAPTANGGELRRRRTSGTDREELLLQAPASLANTPLDWTKDGRFIVYSSAGDLWMVPVAEPRTPVQLTRSPAIEKTGRVSPDLKWLAYASAEEERREIWVQPFPGGPESQRIFVGDGFDPSWRQDGKELYYLSLDGSVMSVPVASEAPLKLGPPVALFRTALPEANVALHLYAAAPDGQRFLVSEPTQTAPPITIVVNWQALVRQ